MNPTEAEVERVARLMHHEITECTAKQFPNAHVVEVKWEQLHPFVRDRYLHTARALLIDFVTTTSPAPELHELHRLHDDGCPHVLGGES